jgi:hypothetical protein
MTAFHRFVTATVLAERGTRIPDVLLALDADRRNATRGRFGEVAVYGAAVGTHGGGTRQWGARSG